MYLSKLKQKELTEMNHWPKLYINKHILPAEVESTDTQPSVKTWNKDTRNTGRKSSKACC